MSRKSIITFAGLFSVVLGLTVSSFAQVAPVSGSVELEKDGKRTPVAGALVEVYRMDVKATPPAGKTGSKGDFAFAGLPMGGTYTFSVSCEGCAPSVYPNVRAGTEKLLIIVSPGDGSKYTEEKIREGLASGATTANLTDAQRKKLQEDYEKRKAEIEAKNAANQKVGEIAKASLQAGNDAYTAKNYDLAIAKYTEGITADPNFVGSTPVLLNNRGASYDARAVETYNKFAKSPDPAARLDAMSKTKADLAAAVASYQAAWKIYETALPADIANAQAHETNKLVTVRGARESFRHAVLTEQVDASLLEAAKLLMPEYAKLEPDAAKKVESGILLGDIYRVLQDRENSIAAYKGVLASDPENIEALAGAGLVLVDLSWLKDNDKALAQEGANYLLKFVSLAPETHKLKEGAKGYLDILKTQSIVPVKTATPKAAPRKKT